MAQAQDPFRDLVDTYHDGIYFVDCDRVITYWNQGAESLTGYSSGEVVGRRCMDDILCHVDHCTGERMCSNRCPLALSMDDGQTRVAQVFLKHKQGHRQPVVMRTSPVRDHRGVIVGGVEVFSDHSELHEIREKLEELERMALLDPLTGIGNRRYFEMNLHARLDERHRYGTPFGLLLIDLDHFKRINDDHGHEAGDAVLKMVGQTLAFSCRKSDLACRWGGEEFAVILGNMGPGGLREAVERVQGLVRRSSHTLEDGTRLRVTFSGGATLASAEDTDQALLQRADALLYRGKLEGRDRVIYEHDPA